MYQLFNRRNYFSQGILCDFEQTKIFFQRNETIFNERKFFQHLRTRKVKQRKNTFSERKFFSASDFVDTKSEAENKRCQAKNFSASVVTESEAEKNVFSAGEIFFSVTAVS